ncbi:helix-hairpin-helix domain-containing protein [Geoalkalibacter halelectricus]|uniref:Uncharacterized protein n=1 Tax=Geoalkalibacter halelectricus TaxID=2847045 RepID=A0ABY5ZSJ2_9BACT|nr:helix-hairpin-helix domain-containing protein [Geoalkalibacter halelectricus]MDO3379157.1 hypothetical protein [Geoalkalibacter halelectricus]UWZ80917.1 hypothetical protein L9S41_05805 [Geoalkalibacter halelectricus]
MRLTETYSGENERFEGDLTLWLRTLPIGAVATRAVVTLTPPPGAQQETISFSNSQGELGAVKTLSANDLEIDFRARRTLATVTARPGATGTASLQVDMGGAYVTVAGDGTFNSTAAAWSVDFGQPNPRPLPALTVSRFKLHRPEGRSFDLDSVSIGSVPTNLQVRLGEMAPFWVRLGELSQGETSPDFAEVLNFFLTSAETKDGFYRIPLVVHSDTLARLEVSLRIDYIIEQPILPPHLEEVDLPYDFSTLPGSEEGLLTVRLPRGAVPVEGRSGAAIRGTFDPSRLALGEAGAMPAIGAFTLSPRCTLAQAFIPSNEIEVQAVDLPLANTQPGLAGMHLSLMSDADGKPSGEILRSAEISVGKQLPDGSVWGSAALPDPLRLLPGTRYWLVVQSRDGDAFWSVEQGDESRITLQCSRDGGLSWRAASATGLTPPLAAQFRLRHLPQRFSLPVQLQIGAGATAVRRRLDEYAPAGKIEFSFDFAGKLREYLDQPEVSGPAPDQPPLCNTDFSLPAPQDATRRLFGVDQACAYAGYPLYGNVDLSRGINLSHERFIRLSLDEEPPVLIDCAGSDPRRTQAEEVVQAFNRAMGQTVAYLGEGPTGAQRVLHLQSPSGGSLCLHPWCGQGLPDCWQGNAANSHRVRLPGSSDDMDAASISLLLAGPGLVTGGLRVPHLNALMTTAISVVEEPIWRPACRAEGDISSAPNGQARLSQEFAVLPDVAYQLRLRYGIFEAAPATDCSPCSPQGCAPCSPQALEAPRWEVEWFDEDGNSLGLTTERLTLDKEAESPWSTSLAEAQITPPEMAVRGDLRLIHEAADHYAVLVDEFSLRPSFETLANGDFSRWIGEGTAAIPAGWTLESGWIDREADGSLVLRGAGPEPAVLVQKTEVAPQGEFHLRVEVAGGTPQGEDVPPTSRSRVELSWLAEDGTSVARIILPLDEKGFPGHAWQGGTPAGAQSLEVRLVHPQDLQDLRIRTLRLEKIQTLATPLTFLGEAPGRLKVRDLKVAYDLPQAAAAPEPSAQTIAAYSARHLAISARPALAQQPVIHISGVGPAYAQRLARHQINTIGELAVLPAATAIEGIPSARLLEIKAAAELLLEGAGQCLNFPNLAEYTVGELMALSAPELARLSGEPLERIDVLQKGLRTQHLLLDNQTLRTLTLGQLTAEPSANPPAARIE